MDVSSIFIDTENEILLKVDFEPLNHATEKNYKAYWLASYLCFMLILKLCFREELRVKLICRLFIPLVNHKDCEVAE